MGFLCCRGERIDAGEDEALFEGGIEATMLLVREPDEISSSVVCRNAIEMVTLKSRIAMGAMPSGSNEEVNEVALSVSSCTGFHDFVLLFAPIINVVRRGFDKILFQFSKDSGTGVDEIDVFAVFGRIKRFGRVTILNDDTFG